VLASKPLIEIEKVGESAPMPFEKASSLSCVVMRLG
jgi:hypothetical protein